MEQGSNTVRDPLRRKEVALTPEERVRQWFISVLRDHLHVPMHMMGSEVSLRYGSAGKSYRADIVVYDRSAKPVAVVECKRPDVKLSAEVVEQALRYDMVLGVKYIFITNGNDTRIAMRTESGITFCDHAPEYDEMTR